MRLRKNILTPLLCLALLLLLWGCGGETPTPPAVPQEPIDPTPTYRDPTHQSGTYKVTYRIWTDEIVHYYEEGEIPDPPVVEDIDAEYLIMIFESWNRELVPVSGDTVYRAQFERVTKQYDAVYVLGDSQIVVPTDYGSKAVPPTNIPDYEGRVFVCWDRDPEFASQTTYYYAIYAEILSPSLMKTAYTAADWIYAAHHYRDTQNLCTMYALLREIRDGTMEQPKVVERLVEQIEIYTCSTGPKFDLECLWDYGVTTAFFALAKETPAVWSRLSASTVQRIDTLMWAFAYIESIGTSDYNDYRTGPGKTNNYRKTWNPNYRLANVTCMVFTTYYFGDGDMERGSAIVNARLTAFDDAAYERMLTLFENYGYTNAYACWGTEDARRMLVYGVAPGGYGSGVGVHNGGREYRYLGLSLAEGAEILRTVIAFNYSGGAVQNEHRFDANGDDEKELVAWIVDGTTTPYLGQMGMMLEFNSGSRSSTIYCEHDFIMCVLFLDAARVLPLYRYTDSEREPVTDDRGAPVALYDCTEDATLWPLIQVGNEDFLYKNIHGYMSFYVYSWGPSQEIHSQSNSGTAYYMMKHLWRQTLLPLGTVAPAQ